MPRVCVVVLLLAACDGEEPLPDAALPVLEQVALVPATANRDVDLLFVIDDSPGMLDQQTNLKRAFPGFLETLARFPGGMPNLHIGVVTTDLGATGADGSVGPNLGSGPGSCSGSGDAGRLMTNSTALVSGTFISDVQNTDGTRATSYTGALESAFAAIVSVGASGCGFEQPFQAAKRALDNHPANVGFLRPDASLAIITLADEDDCSLTNPSLLDRETAVLGPLQSFRCTHFGIRCDQDIDSVGEKTNCRAKHDSTYVMPVEPYANFFTSLKPSANQIYFASIAGPPTPVEVELRTPPGGGTPILALAHACTFNASNGPEIADPGVRISDLASRFPRHTTASFCTNDLTDAVQRIARNIRSMAGDPCLTEDIAMPAECRVTEHAGASTKEIQPCPPLPSSTTCWQLLEDPACTTSQKLRIDIQRVEQAPADSWLEMRCRL